MIARLADGAGRVRAAVLPALVRLGAAVDPCLELVVDLLGHRAPEPRIAALGVLGRLGPRFILAVADRLLDDDDRVHLMARSRFQQEAVTNAEIFSSSQKFQLSGSH